MRVLVTGSRDWADAETINLALAMYGEEKGTLVHGGAAGADRIAAKWAERNDWIVERHEASWVQHGLRAGITRNIEMVEAGADICLAFINPCSKAGCTRPKPHWSHGALHCADLAERRGIPTRRFHP